MVRIQYRDRGGSSDRDGDDDDGDDGHSREDDQKGRMPQSSTSPTGTGYTLRRGLAKVFRQVGRWQTHLRPCCTTFAMVRSDR